LTGLFAVRLLNDYLVKRVDEQLIAANRPSWTSGDSDPGGTGGPPQRAYGLFYVVILNPDGTVVRAVAETTDGAHPELPRLDVETVRRLEGRPFTVESQDPTEPPWRVAASIRRSGMVRVVASNLGDIERTVSRLSAIVVGAGAGVLVILGSACHWLV